MGMILAKKRLLLVGAGHAHLEILRRLILEPLAEVELTVVSLGPLHHYSGMVPGYLQGTYREEEIAVRVPELVERAGGRFVAGRAVGVDPGERRVRVDTEEERSREVPYDLVSFAVGSNTAGVDSPEVARQAQRIKPLERVHALRQRLLDLAEKEVAVVGGGAAGVEIALAIAAVLERAGRAHRITILESGEEILAGYRDRFRERARKILAKRGIAVRTGQRVAAVHVGEVETESGIRVPSRLTVWLTGAMAWPLFQDSGLPLDDRGFLLIDDALALGLELRRAGTAAARRPAVPAPANRLTCVESLPSSPTAATPRRWTAMSWRPSRRACACAVPTPAERGSRTTAAWAWAAAAWRSST